LRESICIFVIFTITLISSLTSPSIVHATCAIIQSPSLSEKRLWAKLNFYYMGIVRLFGTHIINTIPLNTWYINVYSFACLVSNGYVVWRMPKFLAI
jgi:hypothetical protein